MPGSLRRNFQRFLPLGSASILSPGEIAAKTGARGYIGGWFDRLTMRAFDVILSVPPLVAMGGNGGKLVLYYRGQRHEVNKDRFIIGRGKQSSDLTIKDPNVSRQHAMIECLNGQYFMVDMGSTNGVEYAGQRIQRQLVNEGDVFRVCDHELRFSFH